MSQTQQSHLTPEERLAQIAPLQMGLQAAWATLQPYLLARRNELVSKLIGDMHEFHTNQIRGSIHEIDRLLELPEALQQEAMILQQPQQEAEFP